MTGFAAGEIQYRNDFSQSTLFRVKRNLGKSRDKRQNNVVSNITVQVYHTSSSIYILDTNICTLSTLHVHYDVRQCRHTLSVQTLLTILNTFLDPPFSLESLIRDQFPLID